MPAALMLHVALTGTLIRPAIRSVARPALRLGGEWAGNCVEYTDGGAVLQPGVETLTTETWVAGELGGRSMHRRTLQLPEQTAERCILPPACSGSIELSFNRMLDPDVLNARGRPARAPPPPYTPHATVSHCMAASQQTSFAVYESPRCNPALQ